MASNPNAQFARIERLPPYVFSITTELKMEARRRGEDIVDFGMGNPDGATPAHIVNKLVETVQRGDTHAIRSRRAFRGCVARSATGTTGAGGCRSTPKPRRS